MNDFFSLLSPRILGLRNRFSRSARSGKKRTLILALVAGGFGIAMLFFSCRVLFYFRSIDVIGDMLSRYLLSMIFLTFFSLLVFSHIVTALSNLYLSRDLELCHATPAPLEAVFLSRFTFTLVDGSWMLLLFGVPVFLAYGVAYRPPPVFYFSLFHLSLGMVLIAGGLGILITMILVHVFPAQRTRDVVVLLSLVMIVGLYLLFRFLRPEQLVHPETFFSVMQYVDVMKGVDSPYFPTTWITETLWAQLHPEQTGGGRMFHILLVWSTAAVVVVANVWTAQRVYFEGFSKSQEAKKRKASGARLLDWIIAGITRPVRPDVGAVLAKDLRMFFRDNSQWSQLLLLGALIVVYVFNFSVLPLDRAPIRIDFLQNELAFLNMALAGFVLAAVGSRFVYPAVSSEGQAYWIVQTSPLGATRLLWGKYASFLPPMILLGEILTLLTNTYLQVTPLMMGLSAITVFLMVFVITALGIAFGSFYPDFRHRNIAQVATGYGGMVYMMVSCLFIAVVVVLEAGPVYILFMADIRNTPVSFLQWAFIVASFAVVLILHIVIPWRAMKSACKALDTYEP